MKTLGIVRKLDPLGRVVIPVELRRVLDIGEDDSLEITATGGEIKLRKYAPGCAYCGSVGVELREGPGEKLICKSCIDKIKAIK